MVMVVVVVVQKRVAEEVGAIKAGVDEVEVEVAVVVVVVARAEEVDDS